MCKKRYRNKGGHWLVMNLAGEKGSTGKILRRNRSDAVPLLQLAVEKKIYGCDQFIILLLFVSSLLSLLC
jgi:hypothetical protein